jgi:hypothetical protein
VTVDAEGYFALIRREADSGRPCLEIGSVRESTTQIFQSHTIHQEMIVKLDDEMSVLCPVNTSVQNHVSPGQKPNSNQLITNVNGGSHSYYIKINQRRRRSNPCTDSTFPHRIELRLRNRIRDVVVPMSAQPAHLTNQRKPNGPGEVSIAGDQRTVKRKTVKSKTLAVQGSVPSLVSFF